MSQLLAQISISLDGFVAGPNQGKEHPLGEGGEGLHEWVVPTESWRSHHGMEGGEKGPDDDVAAEWGRGVGAHIMGRNMFSPGRGEWDESWRGWWGEDPPFHAPVFVLTHHPREPLPMEGGTTFHFVTDGIEAALEQARAAAGTRTSTSQAARAPSSSTSRLGCSTSSSCTSSRSSSEGASGCSRTSASRLSSRSTWSPRRPRRHAASRVRLRASQRR